MEEVSTHMTRLLIKLFIPRHTEIADPKVREAHGKLAGIVGILTNVLLCLGKIIAGAIAGSLSIIADGVNNLSDASSSIITLFGFHLSSIPQDRKHPYGHARFEYISGLIVSILILIIGVLLVRSSITQILHPKALLLTPLTFVVLLVSMGMKLWQCFFYRFIAKKIDSVSLKASAADSRNDILTTGVVLLGACIFKFSGYNLDGWFSLAVAAFIIYSGIRLTMETSSPLLGEAPDKELVKSIAKIVKDQDGILGIHDLIVHNYGPGKIFASIHAEVDAAGDLLASHDLIDNVERQVQQDLGISFVIHMDPICVGDPKIRHLEAALTNFTKGMPGVQNIHDVRIVPGHTHTNIIFDVALYLGTSLPRRREIQEEITAFLQKEDPTYHVIITFDQGYTQL